VAEAPASAAVAAPAAVPLPRRGLGQRLVRGAVVEAAGFGLAQVIRLAANLVLARLLFPAAFGLMAMLSLVIYGIYMLTDVGIAQAVVRSERGDDPAFLDTAWSIQATRGLFLWVVASLLAWPIAQLFREPTLLLLVPVGSASAFLHGLASTRVLTLRRKLRPLPIVALETSTQLVGVLAMIGLAWAGFGVWSLVAGNLLSAALQAGLSHFLPGTHRERLRIDREARAEIARFGRWIYASSAMTFVAGRADQLVLGRLLGAASLGLYNIGLALAEAPEALANRVIAGIFYPLYARVHNEHPGELPRLYYRTRLAFDAVVHTALGGLVALSPWLITLLYDRRYVDAIPMLQILAVRTSVGLLAAPLETALTSQGHSVYGFRRNFFVGLSTFVAMPLGNAFWGVAGLLWGSTLARVAALAVLWPAARQRGLLRLRRELLAPLFLAVGYGLGGALAWILPGR
jgi:O-antigen/teichoic acid export membrane protein